MAGRQSSQGGETASFITGLIAGLMLSAPLVAWLSPRSGAEMRQSIRQQGVIVWRKAGEAARWPVRQVRDQLEQVQQQIEQVKGQSVEDALAEGRAIAARKQAELGNRGE